jgi:preprotein translocase SecE subunit
MKANPMSLFGGKSTTNGSKPQTGPSRQQRGEERLRSIRDSVRAVTSELRRVTWPSREEWVSATLVTVAIVVMVAIWTVLISRIAEWVFRVGQ